MYQADRTTVLYSVLNALIRMNNLQFVIKKTRCIELFIHNRIIVNKFLNWYNFVVIDFLYCTSKRYILYFNGSIKILEIYG